LLRSDSDLKQELKVNKDLIKKMIFIQNQIIVENQMNQLCINIWTVIEQNQKTYQDINLNNCQVLNEVLWKDDRLWVSQSEITWLIKKSIWSFNQWLFWHELNIKLAKTIILLIEDKNND